MQKISKELVNVLTCSDIEYTSARLKTMILPPENAWGVDEMRIGDIAAFVCVHHRDDFYFNRVLGLCEETVETMPRLLDFYSSRGNTCQFDVAPTTLGWAMSRKLNEEGFAAVQFANNFYAEIDALSFSDTPEVDLVTVETEDQMRTLADVYLTGWDMTETCSLDEVWASMRQWPGVENWHLFLARVDGQPAAQGQLFVCDDVAYLADACTIPAFRRRGCQTAVARARWERAKDLGAKLIWVQTEFSSQSALNMQRFGFRLGYNFTIWRRLADGPASGYVVD